MRAFILDGFDSPPALREDVSEPSAGDKELLVRVRASSVNPVDVIIAAGGLRQYAEYEFPVVIGRDFAGEVEAVGSGVTKYGVGDEVFRFVLHANPAVHDGSWAELIVVPEDFQVAAKPPALSFGEAGGAALAGIAAVDASTRWHLPKTRPSSSSAQPGAWAACSFSSPPRRARTWSLLPCRTIMSTCVRWASAS